jgi:ABC-2 type transport system permease protein
MKTIWTIAKRELGAYFTSPVAYVFLVIFLLLTGFFTFTAGNFFERGEASLAAFFGWHPWLYLVLVPAVGMRVWAEERRSGTIELLLTMPVTTWQAIVAKFIASWIFLALALALTFPAIITVNVLGEPDNGIIAAGYIGSLLLAGAYLAVSCMTSAMTRNQVVAFILAVVVCLFLILGRHRRGILSGDALRRVPARRDRQPQSPFFPVGDRLRPLRHGRDHSRT